MLERIPAHLSQKLSQVASRQAGLALWLWGEAGVGKSDALERLLQSVGFRTLRLSPHLDLAHLLLALLEIPSSVPIPSWLEHSQTRLGRGETLERETLLQAVCAALEGLAPVALAVEDLYQAPLEVREGWTALAGRVARLKGVALLVTAREAPEIPETPAQNWEILRQEAMTEAETLTLLEAQVGATLPPGAGEWVHQRSQGNPALTLELFRFVAQGGSLYNDGTQWHWRIPPEGRVPIGVEALLLERVRHLRQDPDLERVLLAHAFLPENQARACVLAGLPPTVWQSCTARLEREGLLRGGVWLLPMLAGVLQNALPPTERSQWLRQRIEVLCQPLPQLPPLDELPPDYLAAVRDLETAWLEPAEQLRVLRGAAEQAEKLGYWRRSAELWTEVLRWASSEERLELTRKVAWLLREVQPQEALKYIARVTALNPDDDEAVLLELELLALSGRNAEVTLRLEAKPQLWKRWQEILLDVRYRQDDMQGVLALFDHNPELLQRGSGVQVGVQVGLQVKVGYALGRQGRTEEALALYQDALENPDLGALEQAWLLSAFATLELEQGEVQRAVRHLTQALEYLQGLAGSEAEKRRTVALYNRSHAHYRLRNLNQAIVDLEAALEQLSLAGDGLGVAEAQVNLALYHLMRADYRRAETLLTEACPTLERSENPQSVLRLETAFLHLHLLECGPVARTVVPLHIRRAVALLPSTAPLEQAQSLYFIGWAEALYGSPDQAEQQAGQLEGLCLAGNFSQLRPAVDAVWGYLLERRGDGAAAMQRFQKASQSCASLGLLEDADRFGLEVDRLKGDAVSARLRLERLSLVGLQGWAEIGFRVFPQLRGALQATPSKKTPLETSSKKPLELNQKIRPELPRLELLGSLRISLGTKMLPLPAEQGRRLLLALLEARVFGREGVRVLELLEVLYPDQDEVKAENALKQLVYRLRGVLGKRAVLRLGDRYALGEVYSDAEDFLEGGNSPLWRGVALEEFAEDEFSALRDALNDRLSGELAELLQTESPKGQQEGQQEGGRILELLLTARPFDAKLLAYAALRVNLGESKRLERFVLEGMAQNDLLD